jgi:hypothetical protein
VRTSYGNLKPGLNSYQVYGVTESGKKSPVLTVKFYFEPPEPVAAETDTAAGSGTAESSTTATGGTASSVVTGPERPINSPSD